METCKLQQRLPATQKFQDNIGFQCPRIYSSFSHEDISFVSQTSIPDVALLVSRRNESGVHSFIGFPQFNHHFNRASARKSAVSPLPTEKISRSKGRGRNFSIRPFPAVNFAVKFCHPFQFRKDISGAPPGPFPGPPTGLQSGRAKSLPFMSRQVALIVSPQGVLISTRVPSLFPLHAAYASGGGSRCSPRPCGAPCGPPCGPTKAHPPHMIKPVNPAIRYPFISPKSSFWLFPCHYVPSAKEDIR